MKKLKAIVAMVLAAMLLLSGLTYAAEKEGVTYTVLGDSVAYGIGSTGNLGYTVPFNDQLEKMYGEGIFNDWSGRNLATTFDGITSQMLKRAIKYYDPLREDVAESDFITISVGGDDLLGPFLEGFENLIATNYTYPMTEPPYFYIDFDGLLADLAAWEENPASQPQFSIMFASIMPELTSNVSAFAGNWNTIMSTIRYDLGSDAEIFVNTVYNPFTFSPMLYAFADPYIKGINAVISGYATVYDYHVVDVYTEFADYGNPKQLAVGDMSTLMTYMTTPGYDGPVPLHPTDKGYKFILNLHKDLLDMID